MSINFCNIANTNFIAIAFKYYHAIELVNNNNENNKNHSSNFKFEITTRRHILTLASIAGINRIESILKVFLMKH